MGTQNVDTREAGSAGRPPFDLAWLIAPLDLASFRSNSWEREHLVVRRSKPDYYRSLLSIRDLDEVLATSPAKSANIRIVDNGREVPIAATVAAEPGGIQNAIEGLFQLYRDGSTLVFNS